MSFHDKVKMPQKKGSNSSNSKQSNHIPLSNFKAIIQRVRIYPKSMTHADIIVLQKTIGNQAVRQLMRDIGLITANGKSVQREALNEKEEVSHGKFDNTMQRKEIPQKKEQGRAKMENKTGLPDNLKAGVENLSGLSMDNVKVNYNSDKPAQVGALAYTQGTDIHVAPGQEKHLPHEVWHVVQQAQGRVRPTMQTKGVAVNDDVGLEKEADEMGKCIQYSSDLVDNYDKAISKTSANVQNIKVVQYSSGKDGDDAAEEDKCNARKSMEQASELIENCRKGKQLEEKFDFNPFPQQTIVHSVGVATRRTAVITVFDQYDRPCIYRVMYEQIQQMIDECKKKGWKYELNLPRGSQLQFKSFNVVQFSAIAAGYNGGSMNQNAAKPILRPNPNLLNGSLSYLGVTAYNTSTGATGTDLNSQPLGTGVGKTRPLNWSKFIAMIGAVNPFKQGHQMNQNLGGEGTHDNLAPFTASLNGMHSNRVESHVINQTDVGYKNQFANYRTIPTYANNPGIANWARNQFDGMSTADRLAAMVTAGLLTTAAAAAIPAVPPLPLPQVVVAHAWLTGYVNGAFPTHITCTADFIDLVGGVYMGTGNQVVTITNDF